MEQYFIDLCRVLEPGVGETPGYPPTIIENFQIHELHGRTNAKLSYNIHTGTHVDVPFHFVKEGEKVDEMGLERFYGPGIYLDLRGKMEASTALTLLTLKKAMQEQNINEDQLTGAVLVLHSGWGENWGKDCYYKENPYLSPEVAHLFVAKKVKAVGLDFPVDGNLGSVIHPIHLAGGVLHIENMTNLEALKDLKKFNILFFPYKLYHQSGGPSRVVAQVLA
jgi:kynurenine formamidase